ncbi:hypothetical protein Tco_0261424 [Tanacetum coccineum]
MTAFSEDRSSVIATKLCTPLMLYSYTSNMFMQSWGRSSYARAMIELRADVDLKDTIMVAMLKLIGEGFYMCTIRVEYEWKPPRCSSCKVFGHVLDEYPKKIISDVVNNLMNPRQDAKGVQVGPKVVGWEDGQFWRAPSDHGFFHVASSSTSTTPIVERIDKLKRQINDAKLTLVDDDGKPIPKVVSKVNEDSDSEVEDVVDEHAVFIWHLTCLESGNDSGYGTNSLLEQWRSTKRVNDYDPYDDDLYENLQALSDDFDITVHGQKKKYINFNVFESIVI